MSVAQMSSTRTTAQEKVGAQTKLGAASAAIVASGIGCFFIGFFTTLAEISPAVKTALTWSGPVGPLSGKVGMGVILWIITWVILHYRWQDKSTDFGKSLTWTLIFFGLGLLLTFPPVFQLAGG